jgi:hypothetical protein
VVEPANECLAGILSLGSLDEPDLRTFSLDELDLGASCLNELDVGNSSIRRFDSGFDLGFLPNSILTVPSRYCLM